MGIHKSVSVIDQHPWQADGLPVFRFILHYHRQDRVSNSYLAKGRSLGYETYPAQENNGDPTLTKLDERAWGRSKADVHVRSTRLSEIDKKILQILLRPGAKISSVDLERRLGIPRSTIQRRRRHLERFYLEHTYVLKLENLGFRRVDLFIYAGGGSTDSIAKELLEAR